ncbi:MAG TPA: hypothetical protein VJ909_08375 [Prolixibacteraceae bacterium]|nr:hypothetical protein [Prolixibacteraceae bacterium]
MRLVYRCGAPATGVARRYALSGLQPDIPGKAMPHHNAKGVAHYK